jgi:hypothetical protein
MSSRVVRYLFAAGAHGPASHARQTARLGGPGKADHAEASNP